MAGNFMEKLRSFLGFRPEQPRSEFRNPIWGDDDDDGDELYDRQTSIHIHTDPDLHHEITKHMQSMLRTFSNMIIGEHMKPFIPDEQIAIPEFEENLPDEDSGNSIRDYYLKPGYQRAKSGDMDLDGKISSTDVSGFLNNKGDAQTNTPFDGSLVPSRSFCQTIITTSITKPDGTTETRRIVKHGNGVTEDVTTTKSSHDPNSKGPFVDPMVPHDMDSFYKGFLRDFASQWTNFN